MKKLVQRGFTLLEVIVSLGILSVGLLSILSAFSVGITVSKKATQQSDSVYILRKLVEEEKAKGFSAADTGYATTPLTAADKMGKCAFAQIYKGVQILSRNDAQKWFWKRITVSWDYTVAGVAKTGSVSADILITSI
jgi:uncharacterized protein (TIGR02598 family)